MGRRRGHRGGDKGFGYDPMFLPGGSGKTFGELDPAEKHAVSHRARALAQLLIACFAASKSSEKS